MRMLRLGLAQINVTVGDLDGNFAKVVQAIAGARERGVDVLVFPELVMTGYPPEDLLLKPAFISAVLQRTQDLLPHTAGMTVVVGTLERDRDLYNAAAVLHDGAYAGSARKIWLPNYGVFDEKRYFAAAEQCGVFRRGELRFGVNVCEDIWVEGGPTEDQVARGGAELILNLSASPYHAGKAEERRRMIATRAADNLAVVAYVNLVGGQDEVVFDGGSMVLDPRGRVLAQGALFAEDLVIADVNLDDVFHARLQDTRLRRGRDTEGAEPIATIELPMPAAPPPPARAASEPLPERESSESAEVYAALVLGTRDYVRKNRFDTVTLGLSGGIDSALTACVAVDALGPDKVVGVLMPSEFTSQVSLDTALELGRRLGIRTMTLPIADVMRAYEGALAEPFAGRDSDVTEENLQARIRGNYLMALSNKFGWLVLITGNKSEMSVGYSTLYGDMAGGFGVLKDVYKTQVYELSHWRNAHVPAGSAGPAAAPIPELTITRAPSAELRPNQTDQDSLPPYDELDAILRRYVEEDRSIAEIAAQGFAEATVRRVARMVDLAEYKRRQSPPGVKITTRAFGKDRRIPITNGWRG